MTSFISGRGDVFPSFGLPKSVRKARKVYLCPYFFLWKQDELEHLYTSKFFLRFLMFKGLPQKGHGGDGKNTFTGMIHCLPHILHLYFWTFLFYREENTRALL